MISIKTIDHLLLEQASALGVTLQESGLRVWLGNASPGLTSDCCFDIAEMKSLAPTEVAASFLGLQAQLGNIQLKEERGYLNFTIPSDSDFSWTELPTPPDRPIQVLLALTAETSAKKHIRIVGLACLHLHLLRVQKYAGWLWHSGEMMNLEEVNPFRLFRDFLKGEWTGGRYTGYAKLPQSNDMSDVLWAHPEELSSFLSLSKKDLKNYSFPLKRGARKAWVELPLSKVTLQEIAEWNDEQLLSLLLLLATNLPGDEIFPNVVRFEESANLAWLLMTVQQRLSNVLETRHASRGIQGNGSHSLDARFFSRGSSGAHSLFWLCECALRFGELPAYIATVSKVLTLVLQQLNNPDFRNAIQDGGLSQGEWAELEGTAGALKQSSGMLLGAS